MKKIFAILLCIIIFADLLEAAEVVVDDSTPYMPYPERIEIVVPAKETPQKTPAKKTASSKKKKTTKKAPAKKNATKKTSAPKPSSLERGIALMKAERYNDAKPWLLKAIQENRNDPNAWYWYGVYHEKTGGFHQAQYFYSKAVTIDPAFEPLSRVVYYPNDSEKTPLWDPKRPARVYPVATANDGMIIAGRGNFPSAPNDPEIPKVPVYVPPEPGANPTDGDAWSPAVYVPPSPEEISVNYETSVYNPQQIQKTEVAENLYSYKIPGYSNSYVNAENPNVRADVPLYNPPEPGQIIAKAPAPVEVETKEIKIAVPAKKKTQTKTAPRKIVKDSEKRTQNTKTVTSSKSKTKSVQNVKPTQPKPTEQPKTKTQTQTAAPQTAVQEPAPVKEQVRKPVQQPKAPEPVKQKQIEEEPVQPERKQSEYLPPVGQFMPDPGTVSEPENSIPPVGQDSRY